MSEQATMFTMSAQVEYPVGAEVRAGGSSWFVVDATSDGACMTLTLAPLRWYRRLWRWARKMVGHA